MLIAPPEPVTDPQLKPYYQKDGITIYNGDCAEVLPKLGQFDLLLTDPPYGIATIWKGGAGGASSWKIPASKTHEWDGETPDAAIAESLQHTENAIIWGGNYYSLPPMRGWLVFDKALPDTFTIGCCELAWTSLDQPIKRLTIPHVQATKGKIHPTQKPLALMRWCLGFVPDATTILDPFMGSGTTLLAAKLEGRQAVGIELSEEYCEIAANRLAQGVLF